MTSQQFSCLIKIAENMDIFSCKFITDYLDRNKIPYDFDALIIRDKKTGKWCSFPTLVEDDKLREEFEYSTHKECSIRICCPTGNYISVWHMDKEWAIDYITSDERISLLLPSEAIIGKLAYYLAINS